MSLEEWFPFEPMDRSFPPHHWTASSRKREQECLISVGGTRAPSSHCANAGGDVFVWWSEAAAQGHGQGGGRSVRRPYRCLSRSVVRRWLSAQLLRQALCRFPVPKRAVKSCFLPKVFGLRGYLVNVVGTNCLCRQTLTDGRSDGVSFFGGFFLRSFAQLKARPGVSPCRPIRVAPHSERSQGTGLHLTPCHLRFIPRTAVDALLTDGSERGFQARRYRPSWCCSCAKRSLSRGCR